MAKETTQNNENSSKNLFYILAIVLVGALFIGLLLGNTNEEPVEAPQNPEPDNGEQTDNGFIQDEFYVEATGIVSAGADIDRDYCAEGLYLEPNEDSLPLVLMREMPSEDSTPEMLSADEYSEYIGENVAVSGYYTPVKAMCQALMCDCEDFMLVKQIEVIKL